MSLNGALQIGQSAIFASQAAITVAGNNMANAATPGYHRQRVGILPGRPEAIGGGQFMGTGVQLGSITRQIDVALQARLRTAIGEQAGAAIDQQFLSAIEMLQNELTDADISSQLSAFFNSWSELANNPTDSGMRSLVLQQGESLAGGIRQLREEYTVVREEIDRGLGVSVERANGLLEEIAQLNVQIAQTEHGAGQANTLRDQRDALVDQVAELINVTTVDQPNGAVDILVGSIPVVLSGESRGIELRMESTDGVLEASVRVAADGSELIVDNGTIGSLIRQRDETVDPAIEQLDTFAHHLIHQVNRVHSQGQGMHGWTSVTGTTMASDTSAAMSTAASGIPFPMENGSFVLSVVDSETGSRASYLIQVDPDSMSMDNLVSTINSEVGAGAIASTTVDGSLKLEAAAGYEIEFSEDSSGVLSALGINTFFTGSSGFDIGVSESLSGNPTLLGAGGEYIVGSNATALAMVELQDLAIDDLGGRSLRESWQAGVTDLAVRTSAANTRLQGASLVRQSLDAQAQAVSGVSLDEEAIDLMSHQRQFQAAARFISVIDETLQTLMSIA
ncbi:MAG: flagellar hook-associated protein FlgK [Phycisphaerales bacterium]|nr:flagellar hook-associated protein FlgK [Phycisphaerales bacterium]